MTNDVFMSHSNTCMFLETLHSNKIYTLKSNITSGTEQDRTRHEMTGHGEGRGQRTEDRTVDGRADSMRTGEEARHNKTTGRIDRTGGLIGNSVLCSLFLYIINLWHN